MRKVLALALVLAACARSETPATDTAAAATTPPPPANLTAADVAGNWSGESKMVGTDSVTSRWTAVRLTDSTGAVVFQGRADSVAYTTHFDADSMIVTSVPYTDPNLPKGSPQVMFKGVGRLKDGKLVGENTVMLASKPDSVVARTTWEATKVP